VAAKLQKMSKAQTLKRKTNNQKSVQQLLCQSKEIYNDVAILSVPGIEQSCRVAFRFCGIDLR
jgi:hypothetical protein